MALLKRTQKQITAAIKNSHGIQSLIAARLGVHRHSVENYLKRYAECQQAYDDEIATMGDVAENVIIEAIQQNDVDTAKWYCRMKLKHRGYVERNEISGSEGGPIVIKIVYEDVKT